jgi:hypothetical protein
MQISDPHSWFSPDRASYSPSRPITAALASLGHESGRDAAQRGLDAKAGCGQRLGVQPHRLAFGVAQLGQRPDAVGQRGEARRLALEERVQRPDRGHRRLFHLDFTPP